MKRISPLFFATCLLAVAQQPAMAAEDLEHPAKACLWKVEGNGLEKPSWLFGTIHLGDEQVATLHPNAEKAFASADAVYTELKMDAASQLKLAPMMMRADGKTLSESIGEELAAEVRAELKAINPALDLALFETFKTWAAGIMIPLLEIQLKGAQPLDAVLYARAEADGKTVGAVETPEGQIGVFDALEEKDQVTFLAESVRMMREDRKNNVNSIERLRKVYLTEDVGGIADFMREEMKRMDGDKELADRLLKALLDDRNVGMADKAHEILGGAPDQSHFFAVGAGHYAGEKGVQKLLAEKGYKITPHFE